MGQIAHALCDTHEFIETKMMLQSIEPRGAQAKIVGRLSTVLHVSVVIVAVSLCFCLFDGSLFSWHPVFMSLGYIIFMSEGLLAAIMFRSIDGAERVSAIQSHALLQLRAVLCICLGFGVIYRNKVRSSCESAASACFLTCLTSAMQACSCVHALRQRCRSCKGRLTS